MKKSILLFAILSSVLGTIVASYLEYKTLHYFLKPLSTIVVLLIPILLAGNTYKQYKNTIILGLIFCLIGDIFLMFDAYFVFGLASFLIGHICFIYAFSIINGFSTKVKTLIPLLIIAGFIFYNLKNNLGDLLVPVLLYISCIVLMAWQAINLYVWKKHYGFLLIAIGAVLFMVSDSVLAYAKFMQNFSAASFLIAITYWSAITLISLSTIYIHEKSK